jgi:hypothetical protein
MCIYIYTYSFIHDFEYTNRSVDEGGRKIYIYIYIYISYIYIYKDMKKLEHHYLGNI